MPSFVRSKDTRTVCGIGGSVGLTLRKELAELGLQLGDKADVALIETERGNRRIVIERIKK